MHGWDMVERCECDGIEKIATSIETSFLHNNSDGWHSLLQKLCQFSINQAPSLIWYRVLTAANIFRFTRFSANGKTFSHPKYQNYSLNARINQYFWIRKTFIKNKWAKVFR